MFRARNGPVAGGDPISHSIPSYRQAKMLYIGDRSRDDASEDPPGSVAGNSLTT
jgi:hypothetical protein